MQQAQFRQKSDREKKKSQAGTVVFEHYLHLGLNIMTQLQLE
jgi:hypothetical protein